MIMIIKILINLILILIIIMSSISLYFFVWDLVTNFIQKNIFIRIITISTLININTFVETQIKRLFINLN